MTVHRCDKLKMSWSLLTGKASFFLRIIFVVSTVNVISFSNQSVTGGRNPPQCGPRCFCRWKNPPSSISMNCSADVGFPLGHLSTVNASSQVVELDLSNNSLTSLSVSSFENFVRLQTLIVRWNRLSIVEAGALIGTQLQRLDLAGNQLAAVQRGTFTGVEATLVELDLSSNSIANVDSAFVGLSSLARLDLRRNSLTSLTARSLSGLAGLRHLRLDANLITEVDRSSLVGLSALTNIGLRGNPLSAETALDFATNASLSYIDLSECSLSSALRGIPDTVNYVQLRRNRITRIGRDSFLGTSRVRILVLDENQIVQVDDEVFRSMTDMQQLWLNNNRLSKVPAGLPSSLQRLMLDSNSIRHLSADAFPGTSRLNTVTLMGNAIGEISTGTFQTLTELVHLDLSANQIRALSAGLFSNNAQLKTLLLSRNPLQSLDSGCFEGLTQLDGLSLSFVQTRICVDEDAFRPLTVLNSLQLDNSPWLAAKLVSSTQLLTSLFSLRHLSLQRTDLDRLPSRFFATFLPDIESVRLSGSGWVCDERLVWLRDWLTTSPLANDLDREINRCADPASVAHRLVVSLNDSEFLADRSPRKNRQRTGNREMPSHRPDVACNDNSRSSSTAAVTTDVTATLPVTSRREFNASSGSVTSQYLRHNDVVGNNVGLFQAVLIVCTLSVTVVLSAIIISVIVRLASLRRHDVTSGLDASHATGSSVSLRQCRPTDGCDPEVRRSRAPSVSNSGNAGRLADYQRHAWARVAPPVVCSDAGTCRLVKESEVQCLFTNGGCTRMTADEQWRVYTWEDT